MTATELTAAPKPMPSPDSTFCTAAFGMVARSVMPLGVESRPEKVVRFMSEAAGTKI